jgi:phosphoribosyl 1,2-cyclic phosphate phosphodiesterase
MVVQTDYIMCLYNKKYLDCIHQNHKLVLSYYLTTQICAMVRLILCYVTRNFNISSGYMTEITILGCGASLGVPVLACSCTTCMSSDIRNKRTRPSILITKNNKNILVDFGLDIKSQLMRENITKLECAILTHDHADHVGGIDELRVFGFKDKTSLPIYSDSNTIDRISRRYTYLINEKRIEPRKLRDFECIVTLADVEIQFFRQNHYSMDSLGIRIGDFVYSNDVIRYYPESEKFMKNAKCWVIDCMDYTSTVAHSGLDQVMIWYEQFKPEFVYLTNMSHAIDYHEIQKHLPSNIMPLHDGMKINV